MSSLFITLCQYRIYIISVHGDGSKLVWGLHIRTHYGHLCEILQCGAHCACHSHYYNNHRTLIIMYNYVLNSLILLVTLLYPFGWIHNLCTLCTSFVVCIWLLCGNFIMGRDKGSPYSHHHFYMLESFSLDGYLLHSWVKKKAEYRLKALKLWPFLPMWNENDRLGVLPCVKGKNWHTRDFNELSVHIPYKPDINCKNCLSHFTISLL